MRLFLVIFNHCDQGGKISTTGLFPLLGKKTKENVSDANLYVKANRGQDGDYRWEHQLH